MGDLTSEAASSESPGSERSAFGGGDQAYLRDKQYVDGKKLTVRSSIHDRFSTSATEFRDFEASLFDWLADAKVLDCGTGTGRFWAAKCIPRTIALTLTDLSTGMVAESMAAADANGYSSVVGQEADIQTLPFEDDSFDVVVANHMLYHVPDPDLAVSEIARVLRPNGTVLISTNGHGHMREMKDAIDVVFPGGYNEDLYDVFGIEAGEARLQQRFGSVIWHDYANDLIVTDLDAAVDYGLSYPPGEFATPEQAELFAKTIEAHAVDGVFRISTRLGAFVCQP